MKVSIKDNAGRIEESILPHIFGVFKSSKPQSGMGIGLNIAKSIVEDHGGEIAACNKEGEAVFEVVLGEKRIQRCFFRQRAIAPDMKTR